MGGTKENASYSGYEAVYIKKDVFEYKGKLWLHIILDKKAFLLPLVDLVGAPVAIAWLDTNYDKNPALAEAAANATAQILKKIKPKVVAMPTSSKSEWYINKAVQLASENLPEPDKIKIVKLPGGTNKEEVERNSRYGTVTSYTPVTGVIKYMGVPENIEEIRAICPDPSNIVLVDDVYTTGATIDTMIEKLIYFKRNEPNIVLLAREAALDKNYPPILSANITAIMAIPEFNALKLNRTKLTSIKQRELIPQAVQI